MFSPSGQAHLRVGFCSQKGRDFPREVAGVSFRIYHYFIINIIIIFIFILNFILIRTTLTILLSCLGSVLGHLGAAWKALGRLSGHLGSVLKHLWRILERHGGVLEAS